jgi:antitoxin component YwqK of YwqJK toxin-antitoxin module
MSLRVSYDDLEIQGFNAGGGVIYRYQGNLFTGVIVEFYDDGKVESETEFKNGSKEGVHRTYHPNGKIENEYLEKNNREYGVDKTWDESGNLIKVFDWGPLP